MVQVAYLLIFNKKAVINNIFEQKEINKKRVHFLGKRYCISYCCQKNPQNKTNVHEYCVCVQKLARKSVIKANSIAV